jgi:hypothetical protein
MKKTLLLLVLAAIFTTIGCTPVDTVSERNRRVNQITDMQAKMFVDDWDYFWLYDENTKLSQWNPRIGY